VVLSMVATRAVTEPHPYARRRGASARLSPEDRRHYRDHWNEAGLTLGMWNVLAELLEDLRWYPDGRRGTTLSIRRLAAATGRTASTVEKHLDRLAGLGLIVVENHGPRTTTHRFLAVPAHVACAYCEPADVLSICAPDSQHLRAHLRASGARGFSNAPRLVGDPCPWVIDEEGNAHRPERVPGMTRDLVSLAVTTSGET
jgi:hypothetical protein